MAPPKDYDWNGDDRLSWRERDKMKDKSSHRKGTASDRPSPKQQAGMRKAALKSAKGLFNKKLSPDAQKMLDAIHDQMGKDGFVEAVDRFIKNYGMPEDWRTLLVVLDHPDQTLFEKAASAMAERYRQQSMTDRRSFKTKLSILSNSAQSSAVRQIAAEIREKL